ncbi:MAG: hypothetical protein GYB32_11980 [Algicola sp.]|nr:hypothetical protein [Algicola sp.]
MLKISLQIFLLVFICHTYAQKKDVHIIELLPNDTETVMDCDFYIAEIIDNRIIKSNIGIAQKGLMNRKVLSDFSKDFGREILDYLETITPKDSSKQALTLRINQLLISEHTGAFKETGKAVVRLDVLIKNDDAYGKLGSFSDLKTKNSMDVTRKHDDRIRAVLKHCLMQFDSLEWSSIEAKSIDVTKPKVAKILNADIQQGFFETYMELANNNPDNQVNFEVQNRSTERKLHLKDTENNDKIVDFAYYDGKDLYLNAASYSGERHYIKTERFDQFLIFSDVFVNDDNVAGMSMAFGVLGVLASSERQTVMFDLNSGQFFPMARTKMRLILKEDYPDLYKKFKRDSRNHTLIKEILQTLYHEKGKEAFRALVRM